MEAVGRLAGGVAHDFNNLLTVIRGRSDLVLARLPAGSPLRAQVDMVRQTADRAAELTRQLLAFSRQQVLAPRVIELGELVATMGAMLRRLIGEHIELAITRPRSPARILADPGQVEQVILNLVVNARDAMPGGGRLSIETAVVEEGEIEAPARAIRGGGRWVRLTVRDTGTGLDKAARAHLFEPFFTTKPVGQGTGLGLATVYGIVEQSGGFIAVDSAPGHGATFRVHLPETASEPAPAAPAPGPAEEGPRGPGGETVLLVEDEIDVRALAADILAASGYTILEATDGEDALRQAEQVDQAGHALDLVLTDVVMPRMGGPELASRLQAVRPGLPVLFVSGYTDDARVLHGTDAGPSAFLHKPFTPRALAGAVRALLDGARAGGPAAPARPAGA
jgi:CheY-like chemotaxis protein